MTNRNYYGETGAAVAENIGNIKRAVRSVNAYSDMGEGLSKLNTMRGGAKGFKGFVMEEAEAGRLNAIGRHTEVINNNGIADLRYVKSDGTEVLKQLKAGYKPSQIDFSRYQGQTLVVDKGNPYFKAMKEAGKKAGVKVVEGHVTNGEAKMLADMMQMETKITGSKNAVIAPKVYSGAKSLGAAHSAGLSVAKSGAIAGAGFSIGSNIVEVAKGNKNVGEAAVDVAVDTAKAGAIGYGMGAASSAIASTSVGATAIGALGSAAATVSSAPVIGTAIGAVGAASAAISTGTAAACGALGLAAAAPVAAAAAPFVVAGTIIGGIFSLFGDD